jgi:acid phosphatase
MDMSIRLLPFLAAFAAFAQQENLNAVLWIQTAAEFRASAYQTYRAAEHSLMRALADPNWTAALEQSPETAAKLPPAVILDLDETVLDNTPIQARLMLDRKPYSEAEWVRWVHERRAEALPGAVDFLKVAHANGASIFYITNRTCDPMRADDPTVQVLRKLSLPFKPQRLFCRTDTGDKSARRAKVAAAHRVLLLVGDDLNDFVSIPSEAANPAGRALLADAHRRYWGDRWFMLPNPMYGSWERAVGLDPSAKIKALRK